MKKPIIYLPCLLFSMFFMFNTATAGVYKWVDENGRVHFGSRPPADSKSSEVDIRARQPTEEKAPVDRELQRNRYLEQRQKEKADRKEKKARERQQKKERDRACAYSKDKLKEFLRSGRIYEPQKDGGRRWLTDKERDEAIKNMRKQVKRVCK